MGTAQNIVVPMTNLSSDLGLRKASAPDSEFIYEVKKAALREYVEQTWGWDENFQREYHRLHFVPSATEIILCKGESIGWMIVNRLPERIDIADICILPAYQNRGIGSYLIGQILEEAQQKRLPVSLQVLKVNRAKHLYERLGFSVTGDTETHYRMIRDVLPET